MESPLLGSYRQCPYYKGVPISEDFYTNVPLYNVLHVHVHE